MSTPRTPLLVAPEGADNLLGKSILATDLIRGLRRANPFLAVPEPDDTNRSPRFKGITTLWLGKPFDKASKKICAFHLGMVPEWTQLDPEGVMITRGWRAIFEKVIRAGAARRETLERIFRVGLGETNTPDGLCNKCVREGRRERHNGGKHRMCDMHDQVYTSVQKGKKDAPEALDRAKWRKRKEMFT